MSELLVKAISIYATRLQQLKSINNSLGPVHIDISEPLSHFRETISSTNQHPNSKRMALDLNDHVIRPCSMEHQHVREEESVQDEIKECLTSRAAMLEVNAYGTLGQTMFDVCVPKNMEDWDLRSFASKRTYSCFFSVKCIRRSKL